MVVTQFLRLRDLERKSFAYNVVCSGMIYLLCIRKLNGLRKIKDALKLFVASMNCKCDILIVRYWFYTLVLILVTHDLIMLIISLISIKIVEH